MATIVSDTFTDATSTTLDAHTPDVRPGSEVWDVEASEMTIDANDRVVCGPEHKSAYLDSGQSDVIITVDVGDFNAVTDTRLAIVFRGAQVDEWGDHWTFYVYRSSDGSFVRYGLDKTVATVSSNIWEVDPGADPGATGPHVMRVEAIGTSIKCYWNGAQQGTDHSSSDLLTETRHGINFGNGGFGYFDDFVVETQDASDHFIYVTRRRRIRVR